MFYNEEAIEEMIAENLKIEEGNESKSMAKKRFSRHNKICKRKSLIESNKFDYNDQLKSDGMYSKTHPCTKKKVKKYEKSQSTKEERKFAKNEISDYYKAIA